VGAAIGKGVVLFVIVNRDHIYLVFQALLAAFLFGMSAPISKFLLGEITPILLAAFLYLGAGISLLIIMGLQRLGKKSNPTEAQIKKADLPWLAGAILTGGIAAPITLLFSIRGTPAGTASLLLNFEGVSTTLIAALVFKESLSRQALWAILSITFASVLLSTNLNSDWGLSISALGILIACILWGMDNNFTRNISAKDPLAIVTIKGLVAGSFSLVFATVLGDQIPGINIVAGAMLLGCMGYGLSIVLFVYAMRGLGAARTSALFGTAPLAGVVVSSLLFRETYGISFTIAVPLMLIGTMLLAREAHSHNHVHEKAVHEHRHRHDDIHHVHIHTQEEFQAQSHSHLHSHDHLEHEHPHLPDIQHRHAHISQDGIEP
jgi:drug/metabolite transporter (DMT)-like permease